MTTAEAIKRPAAFELAYRRYLESHHGDLSDPEGMAEIMWRAGGRNMLETTARFSNIGNQIAEIEMEIRRLRRLWQSVVSEDGQ